MDTSAVDFPALLLALVVTGVIALTTAVARRGGHKRVWLAAAVLAVALVGVGLADLLRENPRETHLAALFVGVPLPILGAIGMQRATRKLRPWIRWTIVFLTTLLLLFAGVLLGAAVLPRYLPF